MSGPCKCVRCPDCDGGGHLWRDFESNTLHAHRTDDMGDLELCERCMGSGVDEECDECADQRELAEAESEEWS